jgi:hypothetical protein
VGLQRGPLSLMRTTEELLGIKSSGFGLGSLEYGLGIHHADYMAPSICKKLVLTLSASGGHLVGIVRSQTQAMEFF